MVDVVVVRAVHAPTIRPGLEPSHHSFGRSVERDRGNGEARRILAEAIEVDTRREVRAGVRDGTAVSAAVGYFGTHRVVREMRERAGRRELLAPAEDPDEEIEIVAALREDHRPRPRRVSPVAADVAVREVPVDEVLSPIDGDDGPETI